MAKRKKNKYSKKYRSLPVATDNAASKQFCEHPSINNAADAAEIKHSNWAKVARPEQLEPKGDWCTWLIMAGRGFGKTRTGG